MSVAGRGPVAEYLQEYGAPYSSRDAVLVDSVDEDGKQREDVDEPPLVPEGAWREVVDPDLVIVMDSLGYFRPLAKAQAGADPSGGTPSPAGPPLIARFAASALVEEAIHDRDTVRLSRLVELGLVGSEQRYDARCAAADRITSSTA